MRARGLASLCGFLIFLAAALFRPEAAVAAPSALDGNADAARSLSEATGLAISPLLVLAGKGAYAYWRASPHERDHLPWYARQMFWIPALVLILLVMLKESPA